MTKEKRLLTSVPDCPAEIGLMLAMLIDARQRTLNVLEGVGVDIVDWQSSHHYHTVGTLLYHIAAIEVSWLGIDVMEGKLESGIWDWFPYEVRDDEGRLTIVKGEDLSRHLDRLTNLRQIVLDGYKTMSIEEFYRPRESENYVVSPCWVLHHLCQHEAEHRDELIALKDEYTSAK